MFSIENQPVRMIWSPSVEKKGKKEQVAASTWHIEFDAPNTFLDKIDRELRPAWFRRPTSSEVDLADQADPRMDDPDYLPELRTQTIDNEFIDLKGSMHGATFKVHQGLSGPSDIEVEDVRVDEYKVGPRAGGTVRVKLRVYGKPDSVQYFYENNHGEAVVSIIEPTSDQGSLDV